MTIDTVLASAKNAMVTVGQGRGFLVETSSSRFNSDRFVITAAHCLPHMPLAHPASYTEERTYAKLLGPLNAEPTIWAECIFADPIADIAVLAEPDSQALSDENDAYMTLVAAGSPLAIAAVRSPTVAWLLTLDGRWERCRVRVNEYGPARWLTIVGAENGTAPGTSGSPIVSDDGRAIGIVSVGTGVGGGLKVDQEMQPLLANVLPVWLLAELNADRDRGDVTPVREARGQSQ